MLIDGTSPKKKTGVLLANFGSVAISTSCFVCVVGDCGVGATALADLPNHGGGGGDGGGCDGGGVKPMFDRGLVDLVGKSRH